MRNDGAQKLLDYGFDNFETHRLYAAGEEIEQRARLGRRTRRPRRLGWTDDMYVTIPRGGYDELAASMDVTTQLAAPLSAGVQVGEVKVSFGGAPLVHAAARRR